MKKVKNLVREILTHDSLLLLIIFLIGLTLRTINLKDTFIFGYDQTRDAQRIFDIIYNRDIKLVGPESDIPGIFHGPLFYYLIAPIYFLRNFDANYVALFLVLLNLTGIFIVYQIGKTLFNNKVGLIAGLLWSFSYEQASYARFISNPSPMALSTALFFLGLALFLFKKKQIGLIISMVGYAVSVHLNFFLVYLGIFYPIFYFVFKPKLKLRTVSLSVLACLFVLSPFIVAEIKWQFTGIKSLLTFMGHQTEMISVSQSLIKYIDKLVLSIYFSIFSLNSFFTLIISAGVLAYVWKKHAQKEQLIFLFIWFFSTLPLFAFQSGVHNSPWINGSLTGAVVLLFALSIYYVSMNHSVWYGMLAVLIIFMSNLSLFIKDNFTNIRLFAIQKIILKDLKDVVDYAYANSPNEPFSICAITNPLFVNTTWSYAFYAYGKNNYGRLPYWSGQPQYLNKNILPYDTNHVRNRYLIIEPKGGIPEHALMTTIFLEDQVSSLQEEKKIGEFIIQKRRMEKDKSKLNNTQKLTISDYKNLNRIIRTDPRYSCFVNY